MVMLLRGKPSFIHLGLHKTATTFLQKNVFSMFKDQNFISCEDFSGNPFRRIDTEGLLRRDLILFGIRGMYGSDVKIILVVRDVDSWVKSVYNQAVKGYFREYRCFNDWYKDNFDSSFSDLDTYIYYVKSLFDNVLVLRFEDFLEDKRGFVDRICDFVGEDRVDFVDDVKNRRLNPVLLRLFRFYNLLVESFLFCYKNGFKSFLRRGLGEA